MTSPSQSSDSSSRWFILTVIAIVVLGAAAVAVLANTRRSTTASQTASVEVIGESLERLPFDVNLTSQETDPQAGQQAPTLIGTNFDGELVRIEPDGRAKAIYFLAHWCPHCQAEVPAINELVEEGRLPEGIDIYAVSTGVDAARGNYPPERWLETAGFEPLVLRDDSESTAFNGFGGTSFPYAIYLDSNHNIIARSAGQLGKDAIELIWQEAAEAQ